MRTAVPAALGLVLLMSACADRGGAAAAPTTSADSSVTLPDDPDAVVLQVEYTGGFVSPETLASRLPLVSVSADGRVLTEGPVAAIYPGPAWPSVQVQQLDPATVQRVVAHALAAGVADTTDLGSPSIADAPWTGFTVTTAAGTTMREVYALCEAAGDPALTWEQQAGRARLADLVTELTDLSAAGAPAGSYAPTAVAVLARPWTAEPDPVVGERAAVPWPGPALPGEPVGPDLTCVLATGDQATVVTAAARAADQLTPWQTADGARWALAFRPLLPQETGCADLVD